jgi:hypothetical protein
VPFNCSTHEWGSTTKRVSREEGTAQTMIDHSRVITSSLISSSFEGFDRFEDSDDSSIGAAHPLKIGSALSAAEESLMKTGRATPTSYSSGPQLDDHCKEEKQPGVSSMDSSTTNLIGCQFLKSSTFNIPTIFRGE